MDLDSDVDLSFLNGDNTSSEPPRSPYSAARALARDLTLPAVPNMDIPPSPPPSESYPPPGLEVLNAKFDNFLKLKREKGIHFNERIASSSALRNPALIDKLLGFAGIETEFTDGGGAAAEQYSTTLEAGLWDPIAFPAWAYCGPLRKAQERVNKERDRGRGEPVEFVSSSGASAGSVPVRGQRRTMFDT